MKLYVRGKIMFLNELIEEKRVRKNVRMRYVDS